MKAKTNMEGKYIKKCAEVGVAQTQKMCSMGEREMREEIEKLKEKVDEENRVNAEIESFLRTHTDVSAAVFIKRYWSLSVDLFDVT